MTDQQPGQRGGDEPIAKAASQLADQASRTAQHQASRTLDRAADTIDEVVDAFRQATDQLRDQQPQVASFARSAVQQAEKTSQYLRAHEPREIIDGAESWARRQPALAIGGALVLGLVAGRFLRSASPPAGTDRGGRFAEGYGNGSGSHVYRTPFDSGGNGYGRGTTGLGTAALGTGLGTTGTTLVDESGLASGALDDSFADRGDTIELADQTDVIPDGSLDRDVVDEPVTAGSEVR